MPKMRTVGVVLVLVYTTLVIFVFPFSSSLMDIERSSDRERESIAVSGFLDEDENFNILGNIEERVVKM